MQVTDSIDFSSASFYGAKINSFICASNKFKFSPQSFQTADIGELLLKPCYLHSLSQIRFEKQSFYGAIIGIFDIVSAGKVAFYKESFQISKINYSRITSNEVSIDHSVFAYISSEGMEFSGPTFKAKEKAFQGSKIKFLSITCENYYVDEDTFEGATIGKFVRPEYEEDKTIDIDTDDSVVLDRGDVNGALVKAIKIICRSLEIKRSTFSDSPLKTITLSSSSYITIGDYAFSNTLSLESVVIKAGTSIVLSAYSFIGSSVSSLVIESSLLSLGDRCFSGTRNLSDVVIAADNLTIGTFAFVASTLRSISAVGSEVVTVDQDAFSFTVCSSVLFLSNNTVRVCERALRNCAASNVTASASRVSLHSESLAHGSFGTVEIRGKEIEIDAKALMNITGGSLRLLATGELLLGAAAMSDARVSVARIVCGSVVMGGFTFQRSDLSEFYICCSSGFVMPQSAFYMLPNLREVVLDAGGELVVNQGAMRDCGALTVFTAHSDGDLLLAGEALYNLRALAVVNVSSSRSLRVSRGAFRGCKIARVVFDGRIVVFEPQCFFLDSTIANMEIRGVRTVTVQAGAFSESVALRNVSILVEAGGAHVGPKAFAGRKRLAAFTASAPGGEIDIEEEAFRDCSGLVNMETAATNISVGREAFVGASSLEKVSLVAENHVAVGEAAFAGCGAIQNLKLEPVEGADIADDSFAGVPNANFGRGRAEKSNLYVIIGASVGAVVVTVGIVAGTVVLLWKHRKNKDTDNRIDL